MDDIRPAVRWMTYAELAEARHLVRFDLSGSHRDVAGKD
jgi:hypothetical protein